jgi:hypothetical protein
VPEEVDYQVLKVLLDPQDQQVLPVLLHKVLKEPKVLKELRVLLAQQDLQTKD